MVDEETEKSSTKDATKGLKTAKILFSLMVNEGCVKRREKKT